MLLHAALVVLTALSVILDGFMASQLQHSPPPASALLRFRSANGSVLTNTVTEDTDSAMHRKGKSPVASSTRDLMPAHEMAQQLERVVDPPEQGPNNQKKCNKGIVTLTTTWLREIDSLDRMRPKTWDDAVWYILSSRPSLVHFYCCAFTWNNR